MFLTLLYRATATTLELDYWYDWSSRLVSSDILIYKVVRAPYQNKTNSDEKATIQIADVCSWPSASFRGLKSDDLKYVHGL